MNTARYWLIGLLAIVATLEIVQGAVPSLRLAKKVRASDCRDGWTKHGSYCYQVRGNRRVSHSQAASDCGQESSQTRLASPSDDAKEFLKSQMHTGGNYSVWVAGESDECSSVDQNGVVEVSTDCSEGKGYMCQELTLSFGCPDGSYGFGNFCFTEAEIERSWRLARLFCRTVGLRGDLATIHSKQEHDFLREVFGDGDNEEFWIGLHKETEDTPYRWANGDNITYLPWDPQYLGQEKSGYVSMRLTDYQFLPQINTDNALPFFCATQRVIDATIDIVDIVRDVTEDVTDDVMDIVDKMRDAAEEAREEFDDAKGDVTEFLTDCEREWVPFGGSCYRVFFERTSYAGASFACRQLGAELPSFHNPFESAFVRTQLIQARPSESYWIGLSKQSNGLQWSDDSPFDFSDWAVDKLNSTVDTLSDLFESCFTIDGSFPRWTPRTCEALLFYVCEKSEEDSSMRNTQLTGMEAPEPEKDAGVEALNSAEKSAPVKKTGTSNNTAALFGILGGAIGLVVIAFGVIRWRRSSGHSQYTWTQLPTVRRSSKRSMVDLEEIKQTLTGPEAQPSGSQAKAYGATA